MKKIKKILAVVMTLAMVLGMSMTTFAAPDDDSTTSNIVVKGLAAEDTNTTVNLYAAVTWDKENSRWNVAEWATDYINTSNDPYTITDKVELVKHVSGTPIQQTLTAGSTEVTFENVPVGAYVITASGTSASYAPMVAETYDEDETYMTAEDVTVTAKTDGYDVTKQQKVEAGGNKFVGRGETVTFTITTTFPSYEDPDAEGNTFTITDTPVGLEIQSVTSITIGGGDATVQGSYDQDKTVYTIDLSSQIGDANANAGKPVVVTYTAIVTSDEGYSNTANAYRNNVGMGDDTEEGWTGDITITKYAENGTTELKGAEFEVYHGTKEEVEAEGSELTALRFVKISDGVYKLALGSETGDNVSTTIVATNGTVQVKGLEEGNYWFKETKAPDGYSINEAGVLVTITAAEDDVHEVGSLTDTKLSELPETGGIGTTIFTIGGCIIMIAAAGLFFASRRKSSK